MFKIIYIMFTLWPFRTIFDVSLKTNVDDIYKHVAQVHGGMYTS